MERALGDQVQGFNSSQVCHLHYVFVYVAINADGVSRESKKKRKKWVAGSS